jgi:hypothetical protein
MNGFSNFFVEERKTADGTGTKTDMKTSGTE